MAFVDLELRQIEKTVGSMCRRRSPPQFKDRLQINYEVNGHSVLVYETRPPRDGPGEWTRLGVAKFTYVRSRREWKLYWMRRDFKWHAYDPETKTETNDLKGLVRVVDEDQYGAFFG